MTSSETSPGSRDGTRLTASRRAFLLAAGSSAGVGLSIAPASGTGDDAAGDPASVVASPSERGAVREAIDGIGRARSTVADDAVALDVAPTTTGMRRFTGGEVDVLVGSRPILPDERSRAAGYDVDYEQRELPTAAAALRPPASSWVDPLGPTRLAETWAGDDAVETWAEVDTRGEANAGSTGQPSPARTAGTTASGRRGDRTPPTRDATVLVRGVRAHQYARGFGGVGYYEPDPDWLGRQAGGVAPGADPHTPLLRLAFLYADRESLARRPVAAFVREYAGRDADAAGGVPYVGDPYGGA